MKIGHQNRVFITGAASGLGKALALACARRGARVAIADVAEGRAGEAAAEVEKAGGEALSIRCDICSDSDVADAAGRIEEAWGGLDVLVNNAGVAAAGTAIETSMDDWKWMIDINLLGAVRVAKAFLPMMTAVGSGHVVNVASVAGIVQSPGMACYNVAKAGMIALSETMKSELEGFGIGVTVACPSFFKTNLMESYRGPEPGNSVADKLMTRSRLTADDIADSIVSAVEKNELFVFGHREAGVAYHFKRLLPGAFYWSTGRAAGRIFGNVVDLGPKDRAD
jgi:NAD(P)-dependent dehydrogenase (short-subunit alcohol dehydrogenase family)